jgi:hypothetical protein
MSLDKAAKYLEAHGRGNDSMLVHMTPAEVHSLQTIARAHGGSLSINPNTGLAEAGFLDKLLPAIAGAGLMAVSGGAINPWMAAGIVGGEEALRTGDLSKGLTAGLGAYGGAGLTGSLSNIGGKALADTSTMSGLAKADPLAAIGQGANVTDVVAENQAASAPTYANAVEGAKQVATNPATATDFLGSNYGKIGMAAGPAIMDSMQPKIPGQEDYKGPLSKYSLSSNFQGYTAPRPDYYRRTLGYADGGPIQGQAPQTDFFPQAQFNPSQYSTPTQRPASREVINSDFDAPVSPYTGNPSMFAAGGDVKKPKKTPESVISAMDPYQAALARVDNTRAEANLRTGLAEIPSKYKDLGTINVAQGGQLGGYSDGGHMLKGPGDGMSDSIPATISGKQPARLADGEFVVPADVVSHLGNGSTDAGAKRLYSMMDNVRKARTGTKKQGKQIKADKYLPS